MRQAQHNGDRLSEEEIFANANLLLVAGHETTTHLIGNGILALLQHPDQIERLFADPALIPNAIEEILRLVGPVQFTNRVALDEIVLGGKTIRRGDFVFLFLAAANRDPAHFADPHRLDVGRAVHKHVAFGLGHHFCLGAPLARLETQIALAAVLKQLPNLHLAADRLSYRDNFNIRGMNALPVRFGA
jgi:cytochrome P450